MAFDTIEIYVRDLSEAEAVEWLEDVFAEVAQVRDRPIVTYEADYEGATVPVQITERVKNGPYTTLWFNADEVPWASATDCARAAHRALRKEALCYLNDPEEPWKVLKVANGGKTYVDDRDLDGL